MDDNSIHCFMENKDSKISFQKVFSWWVKSLKKKKKDQFKNFTAAEAKRTEFVALTVFQSAAYYFGGAEERWRKKPNSDAETPTYFAHADNPLN